MHLKPLMKTTLLIYRITASRFSRISETIASTTSKLKEKEKMDYKKLPLITLLVLIISNGWQITQSQPHAVAHNFVGFDKFSTFPYNAPFQQVPRCNRHFHHFPKPGQQQNFSPQTNFNQDFVSNSRLNNNNWVNNNYPQVFASTTSAPTSTKVQEQNSMPQYYSNQNIVAGSRLNISKWINYPLVFASTSSPPAYKPQEELINNKPVTQATVQFIPTATTSTPEFLDCFSRCPTTSEYNPICANNRQQYHNEQKFICARRCGQDIQIVRRGSCEGLFPMTRG